MCAKLPDVTYKFLTLVGHSISVPCQKLAPAGEGTQRAVKVQPTGQA